MTKARAEIEAKLVAPDAASLHRLPAALRATCARVRDLGVEHIHDTYFDTEGWRLRKAGYACRLRRTTRGTVIALKSLDRPRRGVSVREEHEQRVAAPASGSPKKLLTGVVGARIARLAAGGKLRAIFRLRNKRRTFSARARGLAAIVSADDFTVSAGGRRERLAEVEIEMVAGTVAALRRFSALLSAQLMFRKGTRAKYAVGLRLGGHMPQKARR